MQGYSTAMALKSRFPVSAIVDYRPVDTRSRGCEVFVSSDRREGATASSTVLEKLGFELEGRFPSLVRRLTSVLGFRRVANPVEVHRPTRPRR